MTQSRIFDDLGRLMNDAASVADGLRREVETMVKTQGERWVADMDLVRREDYDALRELVQAHGAEIAELKKQLDALKSTKRKTS
ncbi:MAG: accessory factor UbiK family protein [Alphaproteobacteria bacterium]|nr:accessory factor UbiK family protein [Alphaproteobacteria bacterium]